MDLLLVPASAGGLQNVIIPSTTLQEVQNRSAKIYQQLRDLISQERRHFYVFVNEHSRCVFFFEVGDIFSELVLVSATTPTPQNTFKRFLSYLLVMNLI
jgi:hypothetical protein